MLCCARILVKLLAHTVDYFEGGMIRWISSEFDLLKQNNYTRLLQGFVQLVGLSSKSSCNLVLY